MKEKATKDFFESLVLLKIAKLSDIQFSELIKDKKTSYVLSEFFPDLADDFYKTMPQLSEKEIKTKLYELLEQNKGYQKPFIDVEIQNFINNEKDNVLAHKFMHMFMSFYNDNIVSEKVFKKPLLSIADVDPNKTSLIDPNKTINLSKDSIPTKKEIPDNKTDIINFIPDKADIADITPSKKFLRTERIKKNIAPLDVTELMTEVITDYLSSKSANPKLVEDFIFEYRLIKNDLKKYDVDIDFTQNRIFNKALELFNEIFKEYKRAQKKEIKETGKDYLLNVELIKNLQKALDLRASDKFDNFYKFINFSKSYDDRDLNKAFDEFTGNKKTFFSNFKKWIKS